MDEEGRHGWGAAASPSINACELEAIWQALRQSDGRDVLVLTDSRNAVTSVRRPDRAHGRVLDMALKIRDKADKRWRHGCATQISWVRGHAGVGVNEIAHRLALNALRQVRLGTTVSVATSVAAGIAADLTDRTVPELHRDWTVSFGAG